MRTIPTLSVAAALLGLVSPLRAEAQKIKPLPPPKSDVQIVAPKAPTFRLDDPRKPKRTPATAAAAKPLPKPNIAIAKNPATTPRPKKRNARPVARLQAPRPAPAAQPNNLFGNRGRGMLGGGMGRRRFR